MNFTLYLLKIRIEDCRDKLLALLSLNEPTYPNVINCSQELDELLVKYENIIIKDKKLTHKKAS